MNDLFDLPVISIADDETLHTVKGVLLSEDRRKISALICKKGIVSKQIIVLPYKKVISVSSNGIMIKDMKSLFRMRQEECQLQEMMSCENIIGKFLINNSGDILGAVRDIFFNPLNGTVIAFEVSEGYLDELLKGRRQIPLESGCRFSDSCVAAATRGR